MPLSHMAYRSSLQFTGHSHLHPEHFIYCGSVTNFPQPHVHSVIPDPGNVSNFNLYRTAEPHGSALSYAMTQYNGAQHQHPVSNLTIAVAVPTGLYYPYMAPLSGISDISVPVNHGAYNQLALASTHEISGFPTVSYGSNISYVDGVRSLNRKNAEGIPVNYQYLSASVGFSSSVSPMIAGPVECDVAAMNRTSFQPTEHEGNEPTTSMADNEYQRSARNRSNMILPEFVMANNGSHLIRGSYFPLPDQVPGTFVWTQAPSLPYMHASVDGACVEAWSVSIEGYQVTTSSRSAFNSHPSIPHGHPNLHNLPLPMQGIGGYNINFPSQVATSAHRISTSSHTNSSPYQAVVDEELLVPIPPTSFELYWLQQREVHDPNAMHQNLPNIRLIPEDEMAMLNIDQHWDASLDVDHMTYEELLVLEEQIGIVGTGLSEEDIQNSLKTRAFSSLATCLNHEKAATVEQQSNFCVVCQFDFEDQETVGKLNCGHEYHGDCIKKWLLIKNSCPICKSTALTTVKKNCK